MWALFALLGWLKPAYSRPIEIAGPVPFGAVLFTPHIGKAWNMFVIIGYVVALTCIFGGYMIAGGNMIVILKALPVEMLIICGGATGAFVVCNQPKVLKAVASAVPAAFKGSKFTKARYMELLALQYDILQKARKEGLMAIEQDVENPEQSALFQKYPTIASDHHVVEFITDYLRMMVSGNLNAHEIESLMDAEIETHHQEAHAPVAAITRLAGGLPAFGIVAAVLGVIKTMGSVGQPPAVLGGMIGSALVGTFLGIFLAYAMVEPLAGVMEQKMEEGSKELLCIKTTLLASMQGYAPTTAIEFGRKVLFSTDRPTFAELEGHVKGKRA
jgi:chemotaxis protein MotA